MKLKATTTQSCSRSFLRVFPAVMQLMRISMRNAAQPSLSVPQFRVLARLSSEGCTASELAEWVGVSLPAMSKMVDLLVERGLVEKKQVSEDKRQIQISQTEQGRKLFKEVLAIAQDTLSEKLDELSETEIKKLNEAFEILEKLFINQEVFREEKLRDNSLSRDNNTGSFELRT